jgi:hypothetical protein
LKRSLQEQFQQQLPHEELTKILQTFQDSCAQLRPTMIDSFNKLIFKKRSSLIPFLVN